MLLHQRVRLLKYSRAAFLATLLLPVAIAMPAAADSKSSMQEPTGVPEVSVALAPAVEAHSTPPVWLALPFAALLFMIATGPLLYSRFWHRSYPYVSVGMAVAVLSYYIIMQKSWLEPLEALMEYVQFMSLIAALYMASGGVLIEINKPASPLTNLTILLSGALLSNLIGTTGASTLLIRPYIRLNQGRIRIYHVVFFIFIVSNVGGALTPIGDPPLFLGFLSGVPFFWTVQHNFWPWLVALTCLGLLFYRLDARNTRHAVQVVRSDRPLLELVGKRNFFWFSLIIAAVFVDPNVFDWVPTLQYRGHSFSFVRELILLLVGYGSYRCASEQALRVNRFSFEPLREVVWVFVGLFGTMIPALQLVSYFAQSETAQALISHNTLYWGAGVFSSVLDNAPTYLNFAAASMAAQGADILEVASVKSFARGVGFVNSVVQLKAISVASVFFGAMTYIGNGPNFMIKAIAEQMNVRMPTFFVYMFRFAGLYLLPVLVLIWALFFALQS